MRKFVNHIILIYKVIRYIYITYYIVIPLFMIKSYIYNEYYFLFEDEILLLLLNFIEYIKKM